MTKKEKAQEAWHYRPVILDCNWCEGGYYFTDLEDSYVSNRYECERCFGYSVLPIPLIVLDIILDKQRVGGKR